MPSRYGTSHHKTCYGLNLASALKSALMLEEAHFVPFWSNIACMIVSFTEAVLQNKFISPARMYMSEEWILKFTP